MRTIAIVTGKCILSARKLADGFNKRTNGEWKAVVYDVRKDAVPLCQHIFAYGCSKDRIGLKTHINKPNNTKACVDKGLTFQILKKEGIPLPGWSLQKKFVDPNWKQIVVRSKVDGRKAEDLDYFNQGDVLPNAPLYTEYFPHKYEYRIVVFKEKVVGRYYKAVVDKFPNGQLAWSFMIQPKRGFEQMDADSIRAAKALGIDYVGFDVVANSKKDYRFLEANSGPILTGEAEEAILNYYLNLEK